MNSRATHRYKMRAVGSRPSARPKHWQPPASKRQPVYYKIVLQTDQFERKKRFFLEPTNAISLQGHQRNKKVIRLKDSDEKR